MASVTVDEKLAPPFGHIPMSGPACGQFIYHVSVTVISRLTALMNRWILSPAIITPY